MAKPLYNFFPGVGKTDIRTTVAPIVKKNPAIGDVRATLSV
jgi:hypothetical protein